MRQAHRRLTAIEELVRSHPCGETPKRLVLATDAEIQQFSDRIEERVKAARERDRCAMDESSQMAHTCKLD